MRAPKIVVGLAGRFESEASIEGQQMSLRGQRHG